MIGSLKQFTHIDGEKYLNEGGSKNVEVWAAVRQGLPTTPSQGMDVLPVPEMLRVIEYCLDYRVEDFETAYKLAKTLYATNSQFDVMNWYASVCYDAKKYPESYEVCKKIASLMPTAGTYFNASRAAQRSGFPGEAESLIRKALALDTSATPILLDLAVYISSQGRFDEAFELLQSIDPKQLSRRDRLALEVNKGWHYIRLGDFKKGIKLISYGRSIQIWGAGIMTLPRPLWDGVTRKGKTILIVGEGGIGDEIIVARFSKILQERGMKVIMSTVHKAQRILSSITTIDKVIDGHNLSTYTDYDYYVPGMDLVSVLDIDEDKIPNKPYIKADPAFVKKWSAIIPRSKKLRVGVRWSGNNLYEDDLQRTVPFDALEALADIPGVKLYSLQRDTGIEVISPLSRMVPLHDKLETLDDALGAIANLDLVITSCTSIAHLSAALGKKTWVILPFMPYYIWANLRKKSPWYASVTLYRKATDSSWDVTMAEVRKDLKKLVKTS
jgi:tetratricopeptide (TPR) repeat protein